jgi:hypothetical protein
MARAVSTARQSIAAVSDPCATEVDHGGVAESPLGPMFLWGYCAISVTTVIDRYLHEISTGFDEIWSCVRVLNAIASAA